MATEITTHGDVHLSYNGRFYSWWADGGMAKHSYKCDDQDQMARFRYTFSQRVGNGQQAQKLIDQVGGPLARDP